MDWIKKNYDKLLLALFGLFALVVGGLLSAEAFGGSEDQKTKPVTEKSELGPDKSDEAKKALADLTANAGKAVWSALPLKAHRTAQLFTASPQVQKAGTDTPVALLDEATPELREGIPNWWLYENGLDLTRDDVATSDFDGDKFTNLEEFVGKSNPRDPDSRPPFWAKLVLVDIPEDKYDIRNKGIEGTPEKPEIQLSRLVPLKVNGTPAGKLDYHVGDVAFEDDKRFTILGIKEIEKDVGGQKQMVKHVILKDSKTGKEIAVGVRETVSLPTYKVTIKSTLSGKEDTKKEGEDLLLPDFPGVKATVVKIIPTDANDPKSEGAVEIKFSEPGKGEGKALLKLTK
jgi:hypothetical protein